MTQHCFPGLKPPLPTIRTPSVARRIAERIVAEVNLDEFYWESETIPERVEDVTAEIVRGGHPATVFHRLHRAEQEADPEIGDGIYGWEGIEEHCECIADKIAAEELAVAVEKYRRDYGPVR